MNKTLIFIIAAMTFSLCSCQNSTVVKNDKSLKAPDAVQANFEKKYPGENDPDWEIDAHGSYEAHFKKKGIKYRADFNPNGDWIETETSIKKKDLPDVIKKIISEKYAFYEITEVEHVDNAVKGIFYDVEFKQKGKNKDVEFKEDGTIIN